MGVETGGYGSGLFQFFDGLIEKRRSFTGGGLFFRDRLDNLRQVLEPLFQRRQVFAELHSSAFQKVQGLPQRVERGAKVVGTEQRVELALSRLGSVDKISYKPSLRHAANVGEYRFEIDGAVTESETPSKKLAHLLPALGQSAAAFGVHQFRSSGHDARSTLSQRPHRLILSTVQRRDEPDPYFGGRLPFAHEPRERAVGKTEQRVADGLDDGRLTGAVFAGDRRKTRRKVDVLFLIAFYVFEVNASYLQRREFRRARARTSGIPEETPAIRIEWTGT